MAKKTKVATEDWSERIARTANAYVEYLHLPSDKYGVANAVTYECSPAGLVAARDESGGGRWGSDRDEWAGNWDETRLSILSGSGDQKRAQDIEKRMAQISAGATLSPKWIKDVGGYVPCIGDAITGNPRCMKRKAMRRSDGGSLTVFFPLSCSGAVPQAVFTELMCEVASALCALASRRTVRLICYGSLNATMPVAYRKLSNASSDAMFWKVPIDVQYLDARLLSVWATASIGRQVMMQIMGNGGTGYHGAWPWRSFPDKDFDLYKQALGATEQDLVITPLCGYEKELEEIRKNFQEHMQAAGLFMEMGS